MEAVSRAARAATVTTKHSALCGGRDEMQTVTHVRRARLLSPRQAIQMGGSVKAAAPPSHLRSTSAGSFNRKSVLDLSMSVLDHSLPLLDLSLPVLDFSLPVLGLSLPVLDLSLPVLGLSLPVLGLSLPVLGLSLPVLDLSLPVLDLSLSEKEGVSNWQDRPRLGQPNGLADDLRHVFRVPDGGGPLRHPMVS